jgi:hypothetical protein
MDIKWLTRFSAPKERYGTGYLLHAGAAKVFHESILLGFRKELDLQANGVPLVYTVGGFTSLFPSQESKLFNIKIFRI